MLHFPHHLLHLLLHPSLLLLSWRILGREVIILCFRIFILGLLLSQTRKPIYWHWVVVKKSAAFVAGHPAWRQARRTGSSCSKDPNSLMAFRGGFLKARWGRGLRGVWSIHIHPSDWLVVREQDDVSGILIISLLVPTSLGSTCWWSAGS